MPGYEGTCLSHTALKLGLTPLRCVSTSDRSIVFKLLLRCKKNFIFLHFYNSHFNLLRPVQIRLSFKH
ncbi:hypothetical protein CHR62_02440 [Pusillimonas sp. NJUB218]|nr:hypothetical protein CHR62_02440 [Pusillimonas sp. NJUB218]